MRVLLLNNNDGRSELQPQKSDARTAVSTTEFPVVWGDLRPHNSSRRALLYVSTAYDPRA